MPKREDPSTTTAPTTAPASPGRSPMSTPPLREREYLVVGMDLRTPVDLARELDRALRHYAHVYACLAEVADFDRRSWLQYKQGKVLEELAKAGDEGAGIEIERRRWSRMLSDTAEMAARAGVRMNVPAFDPDRPLGPGSMVRWAQQGPLDYAGRMDPERPRFRLGQWVAEKAARWTGGVASGEHGFHTTTRLPWKDPRVPSSGEEAEAAREAYFRGEDPVVKPEPTPAPPGPKPSSPGLFAEQDAAKRAVIRRPSGR